MSSGATSTTSATTGTRWPLDAHHHMQASAATGVPTDTATLCVSSRGEEISCGHPERKLPSMPDPPSASPSPQITARPPVDGSLSAAPYLTGPAPHSTAATRTLTWLESCARETRCSCLVHGVSEWTFQLFGRFRSVAFFVLPHDAFMGDRLHEAAVVRRWNHVYVLQADLQARAPKPMQNGLLNPRNVRLRAIESLQLSNEFFDFQLIHGAAGNGWLCAPEPADARSLLSLASTTLLALPTADCSARWRSSVTAALSPASKQVHPVGRATAPVARPILVSCESDFSEKIDVGLARRAWPRGAGACDVMLALRSLRRINAHHFSCSQVPPLHRRMYVMDLPLQHEEDETVVAARAEAEWAAAASDVAQASTDKSPEVAADGMRAVAQAQVAAIKLSLDAARSAADESLEDATSQWRRRVPMLYRINEGAKFGDPTRPYEFADLEGAWARRGKNLGFETGGLNVDSLLHLGLHPHSRLTLLQQFLSLPIGRDMMLWNIIVGARGAYAIDQEGQLFPDAAVPWKQRMLPYCFSVQDCYERSLYAICGKPQIMGRPNTVKLDDCIAAASAGACTEATPFPCTNGCRASFQECKRRAALPEEKMDRRALQ